MNFARLLGLDIASEKYRFANDAEHGHTAASRVPDHWVKTTCGYCSVGCGMKIGVKDGAAVAVRGDEDHPVNFGKLCPKGLAEHQFLAAANRATHPLIKRGKDFVRATWDEALDEMVNLVQAVQTKYGPQSFGVLSTGQLVTEEFYTLGKLVQLGFKTNNYDGNTTLCMASAVAGYRRSFGSDGPPGAYEDLESSDVVILIGANMADNHPILCQRLKKNPAQTLIVVDPRVTKTAMLADVFLPIKPRTDIALINGILHILIEEQLIDREYIASHTNGFEALADHARKYDPATVSRITGLSQEQIRRVALAFGHAKAPLIAWTMGVNHSTQGTETVNAICNLSLVRGKVGLAGASPLSITGQCNAMGTRESGFTASMPGYRKFDSPSDRAELATLWNIDASELPEKRGHAYPDIIEAILKKQIRALWIIATNPLVSFPNYDVLAQALSQLDVLIVQDGFHPTPTTELASIMLPAAIWGEKEGTYTNSERRVSKANKAVDAPGEALPDFEIFQRLAAKLGVQEKLYPHWSGPRDAFNEWRRISAGRLCDYSGITYEQLDEGPVYWPCRPGDDPNATRRLYADGHFQTADQRAQLWPIEWHPHPEQPSKEYPFNLNTGRTVEHWHTGTKTRVVEILDRMSPRAWLEMNPRDAHQLKLKPHDRVDVVSQRGRVENVELRVTEIVAPGQVFMPFHFAEWNANRLTLSAYDPISREPNYKQCAVRVERKSAL